MKNQSIAVNNERKKLVIILFLYMGTAVIIFLGAFFSAYSLLNHIKLQVLNASISGAVFGVLTIYLGLRYSLMVSEFQTDFMKSSAQFSWSNFKREKRKSKQIIRISGR